MTRRIERRDYRTGTADNGDPHRIDELQARRERHDRLTRGKPEKSFGEVLNARLEQDRDEEPPEEDQETSDEPLLGLDPNQEPSIANDRGQKRPRVIVKG